MLSSEGVVVPPTETVPETCPTREFPRVCNAVQMGRAFVVPLPVTVPTAPALACHVALPLASLVRMNPLLGLFGICRLFVIMLVAVRVPILPMPVSTSPLETVALKTAPAVPVICPKVDGPAVIELNVAEVPKIGPDFTVPVSTSPL